MKAIRIKAIAPAVKVSENAFSSMKLRFSSRSGRTGRLRDRFPVFA